VKTFKFWIVILLSFVGFSKLGYAQITTNSTTNYLVTTYLNSNVIINVQISSGIATNPIKPHGVAVDKLGNVYIGDNGNHAVLKVATNGVVTLIAGNGSVGFKDGNGTNASFDKASDLVLDARGNIILADSYGNNSGNNAMRKISPSGVVTTLAGNGTAGFKDGIGTNANFSIPNAIDIDKYDNIYAAELSNHAIRKIDTNGVVTTLAGNGTAGFKDGIGTNASFRGPLGVAVDLSGNIYVGDTGNNAIRKIDTNGVVTTIAGNGTAGFKDGIGTNASFNAPNGLRVDKSYNIYVVDTGNNVIRKIDTNGVVTTIAGNGMAGFKDGIGTNATFSQYVRNMTVALSGKMYVVEANPSYCIRLLSPLKNQNISINLGKKTFGNPPFNINATASSKLPISSFSSSQSNVASVFGNTITINGAGTTTVTASQDGDSVWSPVSKSTILVVAKSTQTIAPLARIPDQTFGNGPFSVETPPSTSSLPVTLSVKSGPATLSNNIVTITGAGIITLAANQSGDDNYLPAKTVTTLVLVQKAPQSVNFSPDSTVTFVKNGTIPLAANCTSGGTVTFRSGNTSILSISGTTATMKAKGTVTITASTPANANYSAASTTNNITLQ